ncbi:hypothetical protein NHX12_026789 [Muraenolepis orangiensis]|uniref:phosphatidate phosphatase n=1 Tax=Muraenolepis orangiensis TaxID=630683 RepID=A0A9Q0EKU6_9TELE|nr:hypothetical protein NHX12_026789 [Muraenolepis orangiensis]
MNYVGQLAGQVFVQVKELYRGLNPATLSGCIDVIVVRQPDGTLRCSPFHVRFGKMGVLRSREKVVDIEINGESVDLHMKLGENGEAFFVRETENDEEVVPSYLATSPIMSDGAALISASLMGHKISGTAVQSLGSAGSTGEGEDMFPMDVSSDEEREMETNSPNVSRPNTPKSDSELITKPMESANQDPAMHWAWGELPQAATPSFLAVKSEPPPPTAAGVPAVSIPVSDSTHFRVILHATSPEYQSGRRRPPSTSFSFPPTNTSLMTAHSRRPAERKEKEEDEEERKEKDEDKEEKKEKEEDEEERDEDKEEKKEKEEDKEERKEDEEKKEEKMDEEEEDHRRSSPSAIGNSMELEAEDESYVAPQTLSKIDSPCKKKDKRSRHLGSDGIYLDDITDEGGAALRSCPEQGLRSGSLSPQSVSSGGDSGVDSYCDQMTDLPAIAISLCGGLSDNREITKEQFQAKAISYQQFSENPILIDDPNLVVKIGSKYYNWNTAAPLMLAMQVFQKPLPKATVENIMKEKMPKKGGRWWFSWRGSTSSIKSETNSELGGAASEEQSGNNMAGMNSDDDHMPGTQGSAPAVQSEAVLTLGGMSLQLQDGPNDAVFSVTTQSDTLGHILPTLGKDWTHQGIAQLYHKVSQEVIEKKPERFKVECLTDIKNLFHPNREPFYAAFGNRPTDVFSYKEVGVPLNRIFTVNPKGELVQEHAKTNISSYVRLGEVVDHVFPLLMRASSSAFPCSDTFSQFTYWREQLPLVGTTAPEVASAAHHCRDTQGVGSV